LCWFESSPGHKNLLDFIEKVFSFWKRAKLALLSGQNEKTRAPQVRGGFCNAPRGSIWIF
jgi:hypothetical protein